MRRIFCLLFSASSIWWQNTWGTKKIYDGFIWTTMISHIIKSNVRCNLYIIITKRYRDSRALQLKMALSCASEYGTFFLLKVIWPCVLYWFQSLQWEILIKYHKIWNLFLKYQYKMIISVYNTIKIWNKIQVEIHIE